MSHVTKEYLLLFNAISDTEDTLRQLREKLIEAQQRAEELFLEETDPRTTASQQPQTPA